MYFLRLHGAQRRPWGNLVAVVQKQSRLGFFGFSFKSKPESAPEPLTKKDKPTLKASENPEEFKGVTLDLESKKESPSAVEACRELETPATDSRPSLTAAQVEENLVSDFYNRVMCSDFLTKSDGSKPHIDFSVEFRDRFQQSQAVKERFNTQLGLLNPNSHSRLQASRIRRLLRSGVAVGPKWTLEREHALLVFLQKHTFNFPAVCKELNQSRKFSKLVCTRSNTGPVRWILQPVTVADCLERFVNSFQNPPRQALLLNLFDGIDKSSRTAVDDLTFIKILKLAGLSTAKSPLFKRSSDDADVSVTANSSVWTWIAHHANMQNEADALKRLKALVSSRKLDALIKETMEFLKTLPQSEALLTNPKPSRQFLKARSRRSSRTRARRSYNAMPSSSSSSLNA